jgi:hypothetical protein
MSSDFNRSGTLTSTLESPPVEAGTSKRGPIRDFVCEAYREEVASRDMPSKKRTVAAQAAARGPLPEVPAELLDQRV